MCDMFTTLMLVILFTVSIGFISFLFFLIMEEYRGMFTRKKMENPIFEKTEPRF